MTTLQLSAQIQQDFALIKNNENKMKRLAKYLKRLVKEEDDPTLMTKEQFFAQVDEALAQAKRGEGVRVHGKDELHAFLNSL